MRVSTLQLWFGFADLVMAGAVAAAPVVGPFTKLFDGCMGGLGVLMCFAAAAPIGLTGIWLLVSARTGRWAAIVIGVAAVIIGLCVANEYGVPTSRGDWLVWLMVLPGVLQLPFGLWLRRALRAT